MNSVMMKLKERKTMEAGEKVILNTLPLAPLPGESRPVLNESVSGIF
jgi:hypothetical protein